MHEMFSLAMIDMCVVIIVRCFERVSRFEKLTILLRSCARTSLRNRKIWHVCLHEIEFEFCVVALDGCLPASTTRV